MQICVPMGAVPIHYFTCSDIFAVDASFSHISCSDVLVPLFFESISLIFLAFSSIVKKSKSSAVYAFKDLCYFAHKKNRFNFYNGGTKQNCYKTSGKLEGVDGVWGTTVVYGTNPFQYNWTV